MAYVGKITGTNGTTGLVASTLYGTCATAAATAAKVVTCSAFDKLLDGVTIHVLFTYSNTASAPTLNVNSTGAKAIKRYGTTAPGTTEAASWPAGGMVSFTYDNTNSFWRMNDTSTVVNSDENVKQSASTTTEYRPIALGKHSWPAGSIPSTDPTTVTDQIYGTSNLYMKPSTGSLFTKGYLECVTNNSGLWLTDSSSNDFGAVFCGSNFWVGAANSSDRSHVGVTYISTGYDTTNLCGYSTIFVSIPNADNTGQSASWGVLHKGNTSVTQVLSSGTKIATISLGATSTDIYAPTDTDTKVTQTADNSSNSDSYELLVSNSANNTTETAGVRKSSRLRFNPSNGRVIMQGTLVVRATDNSSSDFNSGIRINTGKNGWSTLIFGGAQDSVSGTSDGAIWLATNTSDANYKRKLYVAHNGSTESKTYFYAESSSQKTPSLRVGGDVFVTPSSSDVGCKMRYNATTQSLDFVFV